MSHPHLFAGIKGDDSSLSKNRFLKDIKRAILLTDKSLKFLEVAELRIVKTELCQPTYKTSNSHFDVSLVFANQIIIKKKHTLTAGQKRHVINARLVALN